MRWNIMAVLIGSLLTSIASAAEPTQAPPVVTAQAPAPAPTEFGRRDGIEFALGWPSVAVAYVHPLSERASITPRFDLIYGEEGTTNTRRGFGLSAQLEMAVAGLNKFQHAFHVEPGFRSYASQDGSG